MCARVNQTELMHGCWTLLAVSTVVVTGLPKGIPTAEVPLFARSSGGLRSQTYGEVTASGFSTIFSDEFFLTSDDTFVDLGSGAGKLVMQAASEYGVARAVGIELSPSRHEQAVALRASASPEVSSRMQFICGDAVGDVAAEVLASATAVWVANLCFDEPLQRRLLERLQECPSICRIAALSPFPETPKGFERCGASILAETSWTNQVPSDLVADGSLAGHPCVRYRAVRSGVGAPTAETRVSNFLLPPSRFLPGTTRGFR